MRKVDYKEFEEIKNNDEKLVVVDCYADWCGPCKALTPALEKLSSELGEEVTFIKINVDENPEISQSESIRGIPTVIFYKGGEVKNKVTGMNPITNYENIIKEYK